MDIIADGNSPMLATETSVRDVFDPDRGFWDFVILSRKPDEFIQAGHWYFMARNTDTDYWHDAFEATKAGRSDSGDNRQPDLHAVEFRDSVGLFGVHQVFPRAKLLTLFLTFLRGGEEWRSGLSWEPIITG